MQDKNKYLDCLFSLNKKLLGIIWLIKIVLVVLITAWLKILCGCTLKLRLLLIHLTVFCFSPIFFAQVYYTDWFLKKAHKCRYNSITNKTIKIHQVTNSNYSSSNKQLLWSLHTIINEHEPEHHAVFSRAIYRKWAMHNHVCSSVDSARSHYVAGTSVHHHQHPIQQNKH